MKRRIQSSIKAFTLIEVMIAARITARVQGIPVYLRIRRISTNSVTFGLNDSELIQPF